MFQFVYSQKIFCRVERPLTATKVSKNIVTLFWESDLVDGVTDVAGLQQVAGVFPGLSAIGEPFHVMEEPVNHIRTCRNKPEH